MSARPPPKRDKLREKFFGQGASCEMSGSPWARRNLIGIFRSEHRPRHNICYMRELSLGQEVLQRLPECLRLLEERQVSAALEDDEPRAGNRLVDSISGRGRDVEIVTAGADQGGKMEFRQLGVEVEAGDVRVEHLIDRSAVSERGSGGEERVPLLRGEKKHRHILM